MRRLDLLGLAAILAATLAALLWMARGTIPLFDDWVFWTPPSTYAPDDLLQHYNGHAAVLTRLGVSLTTDVGGSDSYVLQRLWAYAMHLATLAALYFVAVPYIGRRLALIAIVPMTLMGLAWLHMLMPFSTIFQGPGILGLLLAMLALARGTRRGDVVACLVLTASVFTATAGLAAIAGIVVWLLWPPTLLRRLWIPAIPAVLWLLWYATYKPDEGYEIQLLDDVALIPTFVAEGLANGIRTYGYLPADWSSALAAGLVVLVVVVAARPLAGLDRNLAAAIGAAVAFWGIIAVGRGPELRPDQLRYLYPDAAHVVLIAVIALGLAGVRSNRRTTIIAAVLALAFFVPSFNQLRNTSTDERNESVLSRAAVTAVEIAGIDRLDPRFNPLNETRSDGEFTLERYRRAVEDGRTIGFSESELAGRSEAVRQATDSTLIGGGSAVFSRVAAPGRGAACTTVDPRAPIELAAGSTLVLDNAGTREVAVGLRRFADNPRGVGTIPRGTAATLAVREDRSQRPWTVVVTGSAGPLRRCEP